MDNHKTLYERPAFNFSSAKQHFNKSWQQSRTDSSPYVILKMPKRKRGEPSLEENLAKWRKELARGLKLAKGFERQRLSKRLRDADAQKAARLEKEILVLKVSGIYFSLAELINSKKI